MTFSEVKFPKPTEVGELWIYESEATGRSTLFLWDGITPGAFINSMFGSNQLFLETGKFSDYMYNYKLCRPANEFEHEIYKKILETSKFSKPILETLKQKGITRYETFNSSEHDGTNN